MSPVRSDGGAELRKLATRLEGVPDRARPAVRVALRAEAEPIRADAAARASWSRRIPASLVVRTAFGDRTAGVYVQARAATAPHARVWEGITGRREARWPLYGNRDRWFGRPVRPFLTPALGAAEDRIYEHLTAAIDAATDLGG